MVQDRIIELASILYAVVLEVGGSIASVFYESALYLLIGFVAAGLLKEFISASLLQRHVGREGPRSIVLAALFGAPLPLCSCGVLPMAVELRKKGASKSSVSSFLVSTPETGVDSIALTFALMGPIMAVVRPLLAIASAIAAGLGTLLLLRGRRDDQDAASAEAALLGHSHSHSQGRDHTHHHHPEHGHLHGHEAGDGSGDPDGPDAPSTTPLAGQPAWQGRAQQVVSYGFKTLFDEIALWIFGGLILTGIIAALLPSDFFSATLGLGSGLGPMLLMVLIGVPIYICASASTPIAAALVAAGLSPGAALVFLLTGPATNLATIAVVSRLLGYAGAAVYLAAVIGVGVLGGLALDATVGDLVREAIVLGSATSDGVVFATVKWLAALALCLLILGSYRRGSFSHGLADWRDQNRRIAAELSRVPWQRYGVAILSVLGAAPLMRRLRAVDRRRFGRVGRRAGMGLAGALAVAALFPLVTLTVGPGETGILQRFGTVVRDDLGPGLHLTLPAPFARSQTVDTAAVRQVAIGVPPTADRLDDAVPGGAPRSEHTFLTGDQNVIELGAVIQYVVSDARRASLEVEPSAALMEAVGRRAFTALIAAMPIDPLYSVERAAVERTFEARVRETLAALDLGLTVTAARIHYLHAPGSVHGAFRDVASALEDQTRALLESEGRAIELIARARSNASATTADAEVTALRLTRLAAGETAPFRELADVFQTHEALTRQRLHLEAVERYLARPTKLINGIGEEGDRADVWLSREAGNAFRFRPDN